MVTIGPQNKAKVLTNNPGGKRNLNSDALAAECYSGFSEANAPTLGPIRYRSNVRSIWTRICPLLNAKNEFS